jgi:hypothetical protein
MVLTLVAELLGGATLVSPGGAIDTETAAASEVSLWSVDSLRPVAERTAVVPEATVVGSAAHPVRR